MVYRLVKEIGLYQIEAIPKIIEQTQKNSLSKLNSSKVQLLMYYVRAYKDSDPNYVLGYRLIIPIFGYISPTLKLLDGETVPFILNWYLLCDDNYSLLIKSYPNFKKIIGERAKKIREEHKEDQSDGS